VASLTSAIPGRNFAELLTESNVREPDGRGSQAGELQEGIEGSGCQRWSAWNRRDDDEGVRGTPTEALAKDRSQADGGELHAESGEAERNQEAQRRNADARNPNGTGSIHPAVTATSDDADLGTGIQSVQLWISARAKRA
jgi:hypothetical protein